MAEMRAFEFRQCASILKATGKKAATLREFRDMNFLITRQIREYLSVWYYLVNNLKHELEL